MKQFLIHARSYILRGVLVIIPLLLSFLAIELLYQLIDKKVMTFLSHYFDIRHIPGLGILFVLVCLYVIGLVFSNVVGKQVLALIDRITTRIPIIKFVYGLGKQLSDSFSMVDPDKQAFKRTVLVDCFNNQGWMVAFLIGSLKDQNGEELFRVFVPAVPHPLTGLIFILKPSQVMECGWSIEEALKMIVSAAIISPTEIKK